MMNHDFGYNIMSYFAVIIDYNPYQMLDGQKFYVNIYINKPISIYMRG